MDSVIFKGSSAGINIVLLNDYAFDELLEDVTQKFEEGQRFFRGSSCDRVLIRGRELSAYEKNMLLCVVIKYLGERTFVDFSDNDPIEVDHKLSGESVFFMGTVRSGRKINSDSDLVIIGDVNPGSEIVATGNISVYGTLRGIAHAGAKGNRDAVIVALNLNPTQIRIADIITRPPDEDNDFGIVPEIAYTKDDNIYVKNLQNRKK